MAFWTLGAHYEPLAWFVDPNGRRHETIPTLAPNEGMQPCSAGGRGPQLQHYSEHEIAMWLIE